jgi:hypothetical protein
VKTVDRDKDDRALHRRRFSGVPPTACGRGRYGNTKYCEDQGNLPSAESGRRMAWHARSLFYCNVVEAHIAPDPIVQLYHDENHRSAMIAIAAPDGLNTSGTASDK